MNMDLALVGATEMRAVLHGYAARAVGVEATAWPAIAEDFRAMSAQRFADNGPGWAPLSPTTVQLKRAAGYSQPEKILYATGALYDSLTGFTEHSVYESTPEHLTVGTSLPYAKYHQQGPRQIQVFGRGSATLPQRELVHLTEFDALRWGQIVQAALGRVGVLTTGF